MSGDITLQTIPLPMQLDGHTKDIFFHVTTLSCTPDYLGLPWLQMHNPKVDWSIPHFEFCKYCPCQERIIPVSDLPPGPSWEPQKPQQKQIILRVIFINTTSLQLASQHNQSSYAYINLTSEEAYIKIDNELPSFYQDFQDVLEKKNEDAPPEHRPYDCPIDLEQGTTPPYGAFIVSHKMSPKPYMNTSKKILPKASSTILSPLQEFPCYS